MKSKTPCPPAFIPVIMFDHATGLCGGMLDVKRRNDPCAARRAKFGILPSAMNFVSRSGSSPSMPRMISFLDSNAPCAWWQDASRPRAARHEASRHIRRRRFLKGAVTGEWVLRLYAGWDARQDWAIAGFEQRRRCLYTYSRDPKNPYRHKRKPDPA